MSTRSCPNCGTQYVATVRRCIDCDANLVDDVVPADEPESPRSTARPEGRGSQLSYELEGWGNQLKVTLEGMLDRVGITRVWEAGALVVPAVHEAAVDDLIATLEGGDVSEPPDDLPRVALEIEGLDADRQADLDARLIASGLAHAWDDEGDLVILEDDEDQILVIIGDVLDDDTDDDGDPLAAQAALSDLYVAVDRLVKKPGDSGLASSVAGAVDDVADLSVPYGFSTAGWDELVTGARELVGLLGRMHADDPSEGTGGETETETAGDESGTVDGDGRDDETSDATDAPDVAELAAGRARGLRDQLVDLV